MRTVILLTLSLLLAPACVVIAYGARRESWPIVTSGAITFIALIVATRFILDAPDLPTALESFKTALAAFFSISRDE